MLLLTYRHESFVWSVWRGRKPVGGKPAPHPTLVPPTDSETVWYAYSDNHELYLRLVHGNDEWQLRAPEDVPFEVRAVSEPEMME